MAEDSGRRRRTGLWELGPAWSTAIAALITALADVGFFAGRATAPSNTAPEAPPVSASTGVVNTPSPIGTTSQLPQTAHGTLLAHYGIDVPVGYQIPFDPRSSTPPTPENGLGYYDLGVRRGFVSSDSSARFTIQNQSQPDYATCAKDTHYINYLIDIKPGMTFCYYGHTGMLAGVVVTNETDNQTTPYYHFDVTIWSN